MTISGKTGVGEVVRQNFRTAQLFREYNIDYCCGGEKSISEACDDAGINTELLISQLENIAENSDPDTEYINSLAPDELSDYIVRRHHAYVRKNIPAISENLDKICDVHGSSYPELYEIRKLFAESAEELESHMNKEESILFPCIQKMVKSKKEGSAYDPRSFGPVTNPVKMMIAEHENEGKRFEKIAELSGNYTPPADACTSFRTSYRQLEEFERDLHRHVHLENNILFPEALRLEEELNGLKNK